MDGPGEYLTDASEGVTGVEGLPPPRVERRSRNYRRRRHLPPRPLTGENLALTLPQSRFVGSNSVLRISDFPTMSAGCGAVS